MSIFQASIKDYKHIKTFIKKYWSINHILVKNKELFYYYYVRGKKINFLFLKNKKKIVSILGYIINKSNYVWLALWKSKPNEIFSGVRLLKALEEKFSKKVLVLGLSEYASKILKRLNYKILLMNHYYFINEKSEKFKLIKTPFPNKKCSIKKNQLFFKEVKKKELINFYKILSSKKFQDFKDFKFKYIYNKYYNYKFYLLINKKQKLIIVIRTILVKKQSRKVLRIIDAFGDYNLFKYTYYFYKELLSDPKIEYIDLLNFGILPKIIFNSGMNIIDYEKTIVPNYFEPFKRNNKKIYFAHQKKLKDKFIIFKGDGDQERPNLI